MHAMHEKPNRNVGRTPTDQELIEAANDYIRVKRAAEGIQHLNDFSNVAKSLGNDVPDTGVWAMEKSTGIDDARERFSRMLVRRYAAKRPVRNVLEAAIRQGKIT